MSRSLSEILQERFGEDILATHNFRDQETVTVRPEIYLQVAQTLRDDPDFKMNFLMDLTAVDYLKFGKTPPATGAFFNQGIDVRPDSELKDDAPWPGAATEERFEVVGHFYSHELGHRLRVKVPVSEMDPQVDSVHHFWPTANWFEREIFDMYGIRFAGHPDLKRILMYEEFEGYPLRKDYSVNQRQPLIGPQN